MTSRPYPLRAITFSVVLAHAAALALVDTTQTHAVASKFTGQRARIMLTRLASTDSTSPPSSALARAAALKENTQAALPVKPAHEAQATALASAPASPQNETIPMPAQSEAPASIPAPLELTLVDAGPDEPMADDGDAYLPRPLLTAAPRPASIVIVPYPDQIEEPRRYAITLALFIDEDGIVRRVRVEGPALPKALEEAARDTFLQTHFRPGEVNGQAVKSLIRIEVVFDNTPTDEPAASRSL